MKVSVIIPTYNRAESIAVAINSVIIQHYTNWEVVVVDDGSTDNTAAVVREFKDPRINYYKIANSERGFSRNLGIEKATGDLITFLDSDDYFLENHFLEAVKTFREKPMVETLFQRFKTVNVRGEELGKSSFPDTKNVLESLCENNVLNPLGLFVKRQVMLENLFDPDRRFNIGEDLYVFLKLLAKTTYFFNSSVTSVYVSHDTNTMNNLDPASVEWCRDRLIELIKEDPDLKKWEKLPAILFKNQTTLSLLAKSEKTPTYKVLTELLGLGLHYPSVFLKKRTFVIIRNVLSA